MLANSDTVVLGVGDSYMQGSEAGDATASFLNNYCALKGYDCINMGHEGIGNMGSVLKVYTYPVFDWSQWKKRYLFWMPTGLNRFDMSNPKWDANDRWDVVGNGAIFTPFPSETPYEKWENKRKDLERSLSHFTTPQTLRQDFLTAFQVLKTYFDVHKFHDLMIFPAFNDETTFRIMKHWRTTDTHKGIYKMNDSLFNRMEWNKFITVDDCTNYYMWLCKKAKLPLTTQPGETAETTPDNIRNAEVEKWIAPRSHATLKANIVFARRLVEVLDI